MLESDRFQGFQQEVFRVRVRRGPVAAMAAHPRPRQVPAISPESCRLTAHAEHKRHAGNEPAGAVPDQRIGLQGRASAGRQREHQRTGHLGTRMNLGTRLDTGLQASGRIARGTVTGAQPRPRRLRMMAAVALLAGLAQIGLAQQDALAQAVFDDDILPPRAVAWRLADRGFTGIGRPRFDGRAYVVEAFGPNGARLRLFVDPEDGEILSRQRLDAPVEVVRPRPAAPGYGWTEEDEMRGRGRVAERLVPPADIPGAGRSGVYPPRGIAPAPAPVPAVPEPGRREAAPAAANPAGNPYGVNPDSGRTAPAPRKVARVAPAPDLRPAEAKPALRNAPEAPKPAAARKAPVDAKADAPKADAPKADAPKAPEAVKPAEAKLPEAKQTEAKPAAQEWKDPPEGRRNVRVIGGATVVPGTVEKDGAAAQ